MEIRRITAQTASLEDAYAEYALPGTTKYYKKVGARMLDLIRHLRIIDGPSVWAYTAHENLIFVSGDDYQLPTLVGVRSSGGEWFSLSYRMPPDKAPWPDAFVKGDARGVEQAGEMILFGLSEALRAVGLGGSHA